MNDIKVSISFADEDSEFAEKVIIGLMQNGINVISNSKSLTDQIKNWGKSLLTIVEDHFSQEVNFCLVLITKNYHNSKWNHYTNCFLLESACSRRNFILPVKIGKNISGLSGLKLISYLQAEEGDFQFVINSFIEKANIASEGINFLKDYKDIESILRLYDPKAEWSKISDSEDLQNEKGIGFDLFQNKNKLFNTIDCYVLFLYEGITIKNTSEFILGKYKDYFKQRLFILIPYERKQIELDKRKENISRNFLKKEVYYINEFLWNHCTPKEFRESKIDIPLQNFVTPFIHIEGKQKIKADTFLIQWLIQYDDPILILKGSGGIGKTTLAKWIVNYVHNNKPNSRVLFIDSADITTYLLRSLDINNELDLYRFYEADYEDRKATNQAVGKKLDNIEFNCNLDNGNIIIIIDGLDEVITRLGELFNMDKFFASIYQFTSNIGNGKVIITTRNYFWDKYQINGNKFQNIEVCPFDYDLTEDFFNIYFRSNHKFVKKAMDIASSWMPDKSKKQYIPFVLDLVTYIVESHVDSEAIEDSLFISEILNPNIYNDYLLFKVCERELIKLDKILSVDLQIKLFIKIATKYNSKISEEQLKGELTDLTKDSSTKETLESFKSHPILKWLSNSSEIIFKYDLFDEHFKNLYLGLLLENKEDLNANLIKILADFNTYNSSFQETLVRRIQPFNEEIIFQILSIIDGIEHFNLDSIDVTREIKNRALSSIFIFTLKSNTNNITKNTELLKEFFLNSGSINNLCIINCDTLNSPKIIFDFSDLKLKNCIFQNYEYFGFCHFNEKTTFENCKFEKLNLNTKGNYQFKSHNFKYCDSDENLKDTLRSKSIEQSNTKNDIIDDVKHFLNCFYSRGQVIVLNAIQLRKKYQFRVIQLKDITQYFIDEGFCYICTSPKGDELFSIKKDCYEILIQFIKNGKNSLKIENVLKKLFIDYK